MTKIKMEKQRLALRNLGSQTILISYRHVSFTYFRGGNFCFETDVPFIKDERRLSTHISSIP